MNYLPIPPVPELARAEGINRDEMISYWIRYYEAVNVPWNYLTSTRAVKQGYKGLHNLDALISACSREKTKQGCSSNQEVIKLVGPLSFGRSTQVFDLPRRQFPFGRNLLSGYRVPFFFVENGTVKLFYLQPRKTFALNRDQLGMVATIHKTFLLDTEFYGAKADVEYVDVSADPLTNVRALRHYSLESLELWPTSRLQDRLSLISETLEYVRNSGIVRPRKRVIRRPEADLPLFD